MRGDTVGKLGNARKHLGHHARATHRLGVAAHDDQALGRLFQRDPALLFHKLALEHAMQHFDAQAPRVKGLVGHAKKLGQGGADLRRLDLEVGQQHVLHRHFLVACVLHAVAEFLVGEQPVFHQAVVLGDLATRPGLARTLADGGGQGLADLGHTVEFERAKGLVALVVDDLQHAVQVLAFQYGCHQHLARAVTRAPVHLL